MQIKTGLTNDELRTVIVKYVTSGNLKIVKLSYSSIVNWTVDENLSHDNKQVQVCLIVKNQWDRRNVL